jgi:hypothetical protein
LNGRLRHIPVQRQKNVRAIDFAGVVYTLGTENSELLPILGLEDEFGLSHARP